MPDQKGQARGNSGVYLHGQYEVQILDSYNNPTYANGSAGALYGAAAPLVNASRPPDQWQTYDLIFHAPKCDGDKVVEPGRLTLLFNGVLVLDGVVIHHGRGCPGETSLPMLQDHDYRGAPMTHMRFRNIWYRPLDESPGERRVKPDRLPVGDYGSDHLPVVRTGSAARSDAT